MIPLRIKVDTDAVEPYVVRLRSLEGLADEHARHELNSFEAALEAAGPDSAEYLGEAGSIRIHGIDPSEVDGDVLLVNPRRGVADRLIRRSSPHNTFLVTERCDQLCVMCSQPPKEHHVDMFPHFEAAALLAPQDATIGISGGEPTLFKDQLLEFLQRVMAERSDLRFHILTNGQHFDERDLVAMQSLDRGRIVWGIPLYSRDPAIHDEIVGKQGAQEQLLRNLAILCRAGAQVELRTVLMEPNAQGLLELARFITTTLPFIQTWAMMQMENIGYGRKNWKTLFYDSSAGFDVVARALDLVRSRGIDAQLYNFPLCTVPEAYRPFAPSTISDWKRAFMDECDGCDLRSQCGGFFEWHPRNHGYSGLGAI
ncbi:His-Xaa-Ser system radical SAM maturase HxsC [Mesorhizobium sp. YR577]|uniref:His-Xaa-Ser system radical SAM maturase HxsC n=1 Tax=Mesorhizobium sp. YR577 TaxID=1884373 RepID=UPI0008E3A3B8|nr:His-Xaa-Ser system radical SAM maturase HxsC [Mesorhizobium sp. YR577]SFU19180.1 His-Xaa-Ser system radical SAM maturase HxsC [Mesorhizobium sp. YR577]